MNSMNNMNYSRSVSASPVPTNSITTINPMSCIPLPPVSTIPAASSSQISITSNTPISLIKPTPSNIDYTPSSSSNIIISNTTTNEAANKAPNKPRKRRKRGNKKKTQREGERNNDEKKNEDAPDIDDEAISMAKRNLINAIELERRNHELTKIRLIQLHKHYGNMLTNLKQESEYLKNKINILKNGPSQNDLEVILKQKQDLRNEYLRKRSIRIKDEQQLKQTNKENQKLVIIIHYLKQQLDGLLSQYQSLCAKQNICPQDSEFSDAQRIVNNLDSLDIVDAESMVNQENSKTLTGGNPTNAMNQRMNNDPWFQKITEENRMLERHIRFLRHIIERETQRCNFKEIIVGKQLISQKKTEVK